MKNSRIRRGRHGSRRSSHSGIVVAAIAVVLVAVPAAFLSCSTKPGSPNVAPVSAKGDDRPEDPAAAEAAGADAPVETAEKVEAPVGTPLAAVDPVDRTPSAELEGPYEDPMQQNIRFGERSYYLAPWRAYMDTHPAAQYLRVLGCVFNGVDANEADAVAEVLAGAGIHEVRIEVGWGSFEYDAPKQLGNEGDLLAKLRAVKRHGIRPLILLNANSGWPCPVRQRKVNLTKVAKVGEKEIFVDKTEGIILDKTGLGGQAYPLAFPLIVEVDAASGRCVLSAPLRKELKVGEQNLYTLKYAPFGGVEFADGKPNPMGVETYQGWLNYVEGICNSCKKGLGTEGAADAGFDLEVWNEYTFGSDFLGDSNYYIPRREYSKDFVFEYQGRQQKGHEALLPMTIHYVKNPANGCLGVRVLDGFANQRPWESGTGMWPGQHGFSRHYYTGAEVKRIDKAFHVRGRTEGIDGPLDALGKRDGVSDGRDWHTVKADTLFIPEHDMSLPEYWHFAYQTEFITRDVQPFPGPWSQHHRFSHNGDGHTAEVWRTETNFWRSPMGGRLQEDGCKSDDPRYISLMHHLGAKALLRMYVFRSHKGESTNTMYNAKDHDDGFGIIPSPFFKALKESGHKLTEEVRALRGAQLETIERVTKLMETGERIDAPRKLRVEKLIERAPRVVFKGDGSPGRPDRHNRDDFACLPFQLAADRYAIGYYVVTRNAVKEYDASKDALDPARYAMPPQEFDITFSNIRGEGSVLRVLDPITNTDVPVGKLAGDETTLTVRVAAVEYPRFLLVDESQPGPLIVRPTLVKDGAEVRLSFSTNVEAPADVSWGPFPHRVAAPPGALKGEYFAGKNFDRLIKTTEESRIEYAGGPPAPGVPDSNFSARWTGKVKCEKTGTYEFVTMSDDGVRLFVDGRKIIENWTDHGTAEDKGEIELAAGREYDLKMEYYQGGGGATAKLLWVPPGEDRSPVRFIGPEPASGPVGRKTTASALDHTIRLRPVAEGDAVRVVVESNGLKVRWPMWDWDVQGSLGFAKPPAAALEEKSRLKWPQLPSSRRPSKWQASAPVGKRWSDDRKAPSMVLSSAGRSVELRLRFVGGNRADVESLLPVLSVSDNANIRPVVWSGIAAYRMECDLDAAAHPGLEELRQTYFIARVQNGYLVMSAKGTGDAMKALASEIESVVTGVKFE